MNNSFHLFPILLLFSHGTQIMRGKAEIKASPVTSLSHWVVILTLCCSHQSDFYAKFEVEIRSLWMTNVFWLYNVLFPSAYKMEQDTMGCQNINLKETEHLLHSNRLVARYEYIILSQDPGLFGPSTSSELRTPSDCCLRRALNTSGDWIFCCHNSKYCLGEISAGSPKPCSRTNSRQTWWSRKVR
jgi:hypothetical protein